MASALAAYRKAGIPVKDEKVEKAALQMKVLGMDVDGDAGWVAVSRERRRKLQWVPDLPSRRS